MAKRQYYRTTALLSAQPHVSQQRRQVAQPVQIPWRALAVVLILGALCLWVWLDARWYVDATRLQVAGASIATAREVALAGEVLGLHGLWLHPGDVVTKVLTTVPAVTEAEVDCWFYPAQCVITVKERLPICVWVAEDGPHWVASDGMLFAAQEDRPDLPLVRGPLPEGGRVPLELLEGIDALVRLGVPRDGLGYNASRGLFWDDPEGRLVIFGSGMDMEPRWSAYQVLLASFETRGIFPWTVDVRFSQAPTYSMERLW